MAKEIHSCFLSSLEGNEEQFGTSPRADSWLLIEYSGHWTNNAFSDSKIPKKVKSKIKSIQNKLPNCRVQVIKKDNQPLKTIHIYIALSQKKKPTLYEIKLSDYSELLDLKLKTVLADERNLHKDPVFIVCTNGEHDQCCGKFGMPAYLDAAQGAHGKNIWQTNHLGGHRFASTLLCLPQGICYGRVREGDKINQIIDGHKEGLINLDSYRGRSCYSQEIQVAEYFLRKNSGVLDIGRFRPKKSIKSKGSNVKVRFRALADEKIHQVQIKKIANAAKIYKSCGDGKRSYVPMWRLVDYKVVD